MKNRNELFGNAVQSDDNFKRLLDFASDAVFVADLHGDYLYVNEKAIQLTGYSFDELMNLNIKDLAFDSEQQKHKEAFSAILETGQMLAEITLKSKTGTPLYVELNAILLPENLIYGSCRDISDRKLASDLLKEQEENLRITLNSIGDAVIYTDIHGKVVGLNKVASQLTGYSEKEAVNQDLTVVFPIRNALTGKFVDNPVSRVLETGTVVGLANHTQLVSKSGKLYHISDSAAPILANSGEIKGVVLVFRDETDTYMEREVKAFRVYLAEYAASHTLQEFIFFALDGISRFISNASYLLMHWIDDEGVERCYSAKEELALPDILHLKDSFADFLTLPIIRKQQTVCQFYTFLESGKFTDKDKEIARFLTDVCWNTLKARQAELELHASEVKFRKAFMLNPDAVFLMNQSNGAILSVNQGMVNLTGLSEQKLKGKTLSSFLRFDEPGNPIERLNDNPNSQAIENVRVLVTSNKGHLKSGLLSAANIDDSDNPLVIGIIKDITELLRSESEIKKLGQFFKNSINEIYLFDSDTYKFVQVNDAVIKNLGYTMEELLEMTPLDIKPEFTVEQFNEVVGGLVRGEQEFVYFETVHRRKDGSLYDVQISLELIDIEDKKIFAAYIIDVTEKHQYLKLHQESIVDLRKQKEFTKTIMDNLPIGIAVNTVFPSVEFVYMNDNFARFYRTEKELLQNPDSFWESVYEDEEYRAEIRQRVLDDVASNDPAKMKWESIPISRNGQPTTYVSAYNTPIEDGNFVISTVVDVSSQVHAEERLLLLDRAIEQNPVTIVITNAAGIIEYVNPIFAQTTGYDCKDAIGKNPRILNSGYHSKAFYRKMWSTILDGNNWKGEFCNKNKAGEIYWEKAVLSPIKNKAGEITHIVAVKEDITRFKRLEKVRQLISEISKLSYVTSDLAEYARQIQAKLKTLMHAENFYLGIYQAAENNYFFPHYQNQYNRIDTSVAIALPNSLADLVRKRGKAMLLRKADVEEMMKEGIVVRNGRIAECWMGAPLFDSHSQQSIGVISVETYHTSEVYNADDLSTFEVLASQIGLYIERVKTVDDLKIAKEKAEESDKLKSAFLANMSHEIRTPMNGILGFTDMLDNADLNLEEREEYISIIRKSGLRLLETVNDIIEISKIETGQVDLHLTEVNVKEELSELYRFFKVEASRKGLTMLLADNLPELYIYSDKLKLQSILSNLLKNAIKFTNVGTIKAGYHLISGNLEFYVKDTGIGIPAGKIKSIFNRFEQASNSSNRGYEGSGLGLAISKAFVEMLGGTIWVDSTVGKGSVFSFSVPLKTNGNNSDQYHEDKPKVAEIPQHRPAGKFHVVVAEDDHISYLYLEALLKGVDCQIIRCQNGRDVIDTVRNHPDTDLVFMDIKMPEIDGYEATRTIRTFNQTVPIFAQTSFALEGDKEKALEAGCTGYLSKPLKKEEVIGIFMYLR